MNKFLNIGKVERRNGKMKDYLSLPSGQLVNVDMISVIDGETITMNNGEKIKVIHEILEDIKHSIRLGFSNITYVPIELYVKGEEYEGWTDEEGTHHNKSVEVYSVQYRKIYDTKDGEKRELLGVYEGRSRKYVHCICEDSNKEEKYWSLEQVAEAYPNYEICIS